MSGPLNATFTYDAEGRRVIGVVDGAETIYLGDWYERTDGADISYYHFNGRRLAMRVGEDVSYLYADHWRSLRERHSTHPHQGGREQRAAVATVQLALHFVVG